MKNFTVSVNIPIFKCEEFLLRCLNSVKNQTFKDFEIILVNDCTPDDSLKIAENFIQENQNLEVKIVHHKENAGLSVTRNTGISESSGKYIFFLDSDDEITTNCLETLVKTAEETNSQVIIGQNRWINTFTSTTKEYGFPTRTIQNNFDSNLEIFKAYCQNQFPATSWNKLILLEFIKKEQIFFIPGLFAQDELWFFHLVLKCNKLSVNREITYLYYLHSKSVIFNRTKVNFENYLTIMSYFKKAYDDEKNQTKKDLLLYKIIHFKEMVMVMQWKALRNEIDYWKLNYSKMKNLPKLTFIEYFNSKFDAKTKKLNFFQNLPTSIGFKVFVKRFNG